VRCEGDQQLAGGLRGGGKKECPKEGTAKLPLINKEDPDPKVQVVPLTLFGTGKLEPLGWGEIGGGGTERASLEMSPLRDEDKEKAIIRTPTRKVKQVGKRKGVGQERRNKAEL